MQIGPEHELLLASLDLSVPRDFLGWRAVLTNRQFDSSRFLDHVRRHRVNRIVLEGLPGAPGRWSSLDLTALRTALGQQGRFVSMWAMELTQRLKDIGSALEEEGIPYLVLKGPILSQILYGDPCKREFGDLDILVERSSMKAAGKVLNGLGFRPSGSLHGGAEPPWHRNFLDDRGRLIELHTEVDRPAILWPPSVGALLRRKRTVEVGGLPLPTLGPEDNVLYAALHGARHRWKRFQWVQDMRMALIVENVDSDDLAAITRQFGIERRFLISMALLEVLGDDQARKFGARESLDSFPWRLVQNFLVELMSGNNRKDHPVRRIWTDLRMADAGDKAGHVLRTLRGVTVR